MKRPKIALESEQQVRNLYLHYIMYVPPPIVSKLAWRAFDGMYRPWVEYTEGAEEQLHNLRDREVPQIYAFNHLTDIHDQFVSAASLFNIDPQTAGNTRVLAKDPVVRDMNKVGGLANKLGGIPVFRKKDNGDDILMQTANDAMFTAAAIILEERQNLAIYPEGTHNKQNPAQLGKVRSGIGEIATRVLTMHSPVAITPIGMSYGQPGERQNPRNATVIVGNPYVVSRHDSVEEITEITANRLQRAVTTAFNKHPVV